MNLSVEVLAGLSRLAANDEAQAVSLVGRWRDQTRSGQNIMLARHQRQASFTVPATNYKLSTVGPPVGRGAMASVYITLVGIAKKSDPAYPYVLANELICNSLARLLLLPCPPGAMMTHGGVQHFFSLDFNLAGHSLPPANPQAIIDEDPRVAWGIILFDVLVANADRHRENLAFDTTTKRVQIFDHSHALFGTSGDISARLGDITTKLAIGGHCLSGIIATDDGRSEWLDKIETIPDFFIDGIIDAACQVGLPNVHHTECKAFLKQRRDGLRSLIDANKAEFPALARTNP